jgi:antitoxin ParD1/3/4
MGLVKKTVNVTDQQEDWIKTQIAGGHYGNDSELIRDLIRKEQARNAELDALRAALIEGEKSGISDRTPEEIFDAVVERKRKRGEL